MSALNQSVVPAQTGRLRGNYGQLCGRFRKTHKLQAMRLTTAQILLTKSTAADLAGSEVRVRLYGSRLDDASRSGDVDLLPVLPGPVDPPALLAGCLAAWISRGMAGARWMSRLASPTYSPSSCAKSPRVKKACCEAGARAYPAFAFPRTGCAKGMLAPVFHRFHSGPRQVTGSRPGFRRGSAGRARIRSCPCPPNKHPPRHTSTLCMRHHISMLALVRRCPAE